MRLTISAALAVTANAQTAPSPEALEFFETRVRPVLVKSCYPCHSRDAKVAQGGLVVDSRDGIRRGGQSGPAVVPGKPSESLLIKVIRYEGRLEMPIGQKLPDAVIADLTRWVEAGAADPRESKVAPIYSQIDLEKGREFWAFQPPKAAAPPPVRQKAWARTTIDRFILARLESEKLVPVADADRRSLLRRVTFDLTGLPPGPEEVDAFLNDMSKNAFTKVVDRLLASQAFGERWGRHWMDVARYADSMGRTRNIAFPNAWRYRDYVIRSFNEDKPFNQFLTEQIAGDLLDASAPEKRNEYKVATGFLALGAHDLNEQDRKQAVMDVIDEQINVTTRGFLALTVGCARCHDHKFDPIPTKDYYAMAGIFRSSEIYSGLRTRPQFNQVYFTPARLLTLEGIAGEDESVASRRASMWEKITAAEKARERQEVVKLGRAWSQLGTPPNVAMGMKEGAKAVDCEVNQRGDPHSLGETVPRGFVQVLDSAGAASPKIEAGQSGRLQLAGWMTRRDNPLTARVAVNRMWHYLFGRGIVETVDNFGKSGSLPSNQALLDYMAVRFMDQGWSVKKMIREIVLSHAYQLSTAYHERNFQVDPDNKRYWRMNRRRLEVEAIRDSMLAISGKLERTPPVTQPVHELGANTLLNRPRKKLDEQWERSLACRTVYLPVIRNAVSRFLETFDFPEPSETRGRRDVTTVATQALFLMNDPFVGEQSRVAAEQAIAAENTEGGRITRAYRQTLGREPTPVERDRALTYLRNASETASGDDSTSSGQSTESLARFYQALFSSAEFRYRN